MSCSKLGFPRGTDCTDKSALMVMMGVRCWRKVREKLVGNEKFTELRSLEEDITVTRETNTQTELGGKSPVNEQVGERQREGQGWTCGVQEGGAATLSRFLHAHTYKARSGNSGAFGIHSYTV